MGTDYMLNNLCGFSIIDPKINEVLLETDNMEIQSIDVDHEEKAINVDMTANNNGSFTMDIGNLHIEDGFWNIYNPPEPNQEFKIEMDGTFEVKIQKRKHKNNRINKKWAKRYGYDVKNIPFHSEFPKCVINQNNQGVEVLAYQGFERS